MSRGDSFLREAPSFMSSWMALRHNVSTSLSLSSDLGVIFAPDLDYIHLWKASVPLLWSSSFAEQAVKNTACVELSTLHSGWLISHPWPKEVVMISFIFSRFFYERTCWCWFYQFF
jgi:hypothetical protein